MYQIIRQPGEVYDFAAEELAVYYARMTGAILRRDEAPFGTETPVWLGSPAWLAQQGIAVPAQALRHDGYWLSVTQERVAVTSLEPRGVLYGVYRLLENAGCRWLFPGRAGEVIPTHPADYAFAPFETVDNPDFAVRASTDDTHMAEITDSFVKETLEKFDWAGKNRFNTYFLGVDLFTGDTFLKPFMMRELTKRGFRLEVGGHGTWQFVRRELFEQKPELFREVDGRRRPDGNFCSSNPEAVQMVIDGVGALMQKVPNIGCFHLWFEDVFDGSWCQCEKCRHLTSAQQAFNVIGAVARAYPDLAVDFIMYHDTADASALPGDLPANVSAYYAPRERCYAHRIADPACERNRVYYRQLTDAAGKFAAVYPFEYYTDMILFNKMGTNVQRTLWQDMQDYKALGVNAVTLLMFNRYSWFAYKLCMLTFARTAWRLNTDYMALRRELCRACYGQSAAAMEEYYALQEQATDRLLAFCGYDDVHDIRNIIPLNEAYGKQHLAALDEAMGLYDRMGEVLARAVAAEGDAAVRYLLNSEAACLAITRATAMVTMRLMRARHAKAFEGMADEAFDAEMDALIAENDRIAKMGSRLPTELVGINGKTTFQDHLCGDLNTFYRSLKSREESKDFKTF